MGHEAEPGPAEAVGHDATGTGPGTGDETAPVEAGGVRDGMENDSVADGVVANGEAEEAMAPDQTTGEPRVDAALKLLDRLPGLPVSDHPELFEQVHARLSEVLGELEPGPGAAGPAGR